MSRATLLLALSAVLLPGLALADDTTVYKSKNADGTSVYTQIETRDAEARQVNGRDPAAPAAAPEAKPKTDVEQACERAQLNLKLLASGNPVRRDKDGDGTPEDLSAEEMATEKDLAQRQATAYCPSDAPQS
ncbi:DUF4124 domain-containing protein [Arenimonas sp. MALMAid1274]|uniref:DUF4124 domain-containing protein n=1 Tax=Arenimonas sp. MALMAid1274 TaxID=3411630 RepID=UPI003BA2F7DA